MSSAPGIRGTERLLTHPFHDGGFVLIEPEVLRAIDPFRQRSSQAPEAGGILIGYRRADHLHIIEATVPGPGDIGTRISFHRDDLSHQRRASARWQDSHGYLDYLGEWHTHPEMSPSPSSTDRRAWQEVVARHPTEVFVFAILGIENGMWVGCGRGQRLDLRACVPSNQNVGAPLSHTSS
jgi:integrative and conjugative element protein (TIGR02256 family)